MSLFYNCGCYYIIDVIVILLLLLLYYCFYYYIIVVIIILLNISICIIKVFLILEKSRHCR